MKRNCMILAVVLLCGCGSQKWSPTQVAILKAEAHFFACDFGPYKQYVERVSLVNGMDSPRHVDQTVYLPRCNVHEFFHEAYHVMYKSDDDAEAERFARFCTRRHRWE